MSALKSLLGIAVGHPWYQVCNGGDRLADFTDLFKELAEFQIQIRFDETLRKDAIRFCLNAGNRSVTEAERRALTGRIHDRLDNHEAMYGKEVAFVGADGLIRSRDNLKTPAIVDCRRRCSHSR